MGQLRWINPGLYQQTTTSTHKRKNKQAENKQDRILNQTILQYTLTKENVCVWECGWGTVSVIVIYIYNKYYINQHQSAMHSCNQLRLSRTSCTWHGNLTLSQVPHSIWAATLWPRSLASNIDTDTGAGHTYYIYILWCSYAGHPIPLKPTSPCTSSINANMTMVIRPCLFREQTM